MHLISTCSPEALRYSNIAMHSCPSHDFIPGNQIFSPGKVKGGETSPASLVLAGPLFQGGLQLTKNQMHV